jgi:AraC-like DNA-binding protein
VSNLLKELVLETCRIGVLDGRRESHVLTGRLLVEQLTHAAPLGFTLTLPRDRRAQNAALAMWAEPGAHWDLEQLAAAAGASGRTLQRHFLSETGLRLGQWLQRARVFAASNSLLDGASVTDAGLLAGYASTSAFIATFKKEVGLTPLQYKRLAVGASGQSQAAASLKQKAG